MLNLKYPLEKIVIILFIILMCYLIFTKIIKDNDPIKVATEQKNQIFKQVDKNRKGKVTKYTVYGTHCNIEGTLDIINISGIKISKTELILRNLKGEETRNRC